MQNEKVALFIIFGGSGDLARRKLYPSLFRLYQKGYLDQHFAVIGTARRPWTDDYYHQVISDSLSSIQAPTDQIAAFTDHFYYQAHDVTNSEHYVVLENLAEKLDQKYDLQNNRIFYMAMSPNFFGTIAKHLKTENILTTAGFNRLIIEKPFGHDYNSAEELNEQIRSSFTENQIYRIDHYLGKEMVQNISAIRFGNNIIESLWNNRYIDNIQITLSEALGVEERAGYYESAGAMRDMVQNHISQIATLLAMEPPVSFSAADIRREKIKVLRSLHIDTPEEARRNFVRGQYAAATVDGTRLESYREATQVNSESNVETFVAGKMEFENYRWAGVPFYVRTGKRLAKKETRVDVVFKQLPMNIFETISDEDKLSDNVLTIYVEPTEGFGLRVNAKRLGQGFETRPVDLDFRHSAAAAGNNPEAYERLLLDALNGDSTNFTHWDELSQTWKFADVVEKVWAETKPTDFPNYPSGSMGPVAADKLLQRDGRYWIYNPMQATPDK
ncbi:glucose-6-phosphate dehydrogenase [Loigolactobacillus binensis]|uniref:Glucose-6-phosphate 1-dehydrogenase n=1 Tax=Loigolactobacillus binensis TaxID=2559922 RepID=A0ABW3E9T0_9LACO|nr:glucose-6-phosphate dehydrogenase [Loigolactobacillus binensis]